MKARETLREAARDVATGTAWSVMFTALFLAVVGGAAVVVAADGTRAVRAAHEFVDSGAATLVQEAQGRADGAACDALRALPSVRAAGAVRAVGDDADAVPAALPRSSVPTFAMSAGFPSLLPVDGTADGVGPVVSADVAVALGLAPGSVLTTTRGPVPVQGTYVYPDDGRDPELGYAALVPTTDDGTPFDACWATVWPEDAAVGAALGRTVLPGRGGEEDARPTLRQLTTTLGARFVDPQVVRPRVVAGAGGVSGLLLGLVFVLRRRLALAADRHVGVSPQAQVGGQLAQAALWTVVGAVAVCPVITAVVRGLAVPDAGPIVAASAVVVGCGALGVLVGVVGGVALVRERALFRYFKQR